MDKNKDSQHTELIDNRLRVRYKLIKVKEIL
jgi:hypothetical protein